MATFNTCPVEGCKEPLPHQHLCCIRHWRMVPVNLRRGVMLAFKAWRSTTYKFSGATAEGILASAEVLRERQREAIAAVNEKETKRAIAAAAGGDVLDFG